MLLAKAGEKGLVRRTWLRMCAEANIDGVEMMLMDGTRVEIIQQAESSHPR